LAEQYYRIFETNEFIKRVSKFSQRDALFIQNKLITYVYPQLKNEPHFGNTPKSILAICKNAHLKKRERFFLKFYFS